MTEILKSNSLGFPALPQPKPPVWRMRIKLSQDCIFHVLQTDAKEAGTGFPVFAYVCTKCQETVRNRVVDPERREQLHMLTPAQTSVLLAHRCGDKLPKLPKTPVTLEGQV